MFDFIGLAKELLAGFNAIMRRNQQVHDEQNGVAQVRAKDNADVVKEIVDTNAARADQSFRDSVQHEFERKPGT